MIGLQQASSAAVLRQPETELPLAEHQLVTASAPARFLRGATYPFRGLKFLLTRPKLWPFVVLPVVITGGFMLTAMAGTTVVVPTITGFLFPPGYMDTISTAAVYALAGLVWVVSFLVLGLLGYFAGTLVAIPFNDRLGAEVERITLGREDEPFDWQRFFGDLKVSIRHSIAGFLLWAVCMVLLLGLNLIPVVGSVVEVILSALVSGYFAAHGTLDGAMSRRRMGFRHKLRTLFKNLPLTLGYGMATALLLWIPLLNLLTVPIAVVGGTLLFATLERDGGVPEPT